MRWPRWWPTALAAVGLAITSVTVGTGGAVPPAAMVLAGGLIGVAGVAQSHRQKPSPVSPPERELTPFEWLLENDPVVREVAEAAERRELAAARDAAREAELVKQRAEWAAGAKRRNERADYERERSVKDWEAAAAGYRVELAQALAAESPDELPSKAIHREFVAGRIQAYEAALEWVRSAPSTQILKQSVAGNWLSQTEEFKNHLMDRITGPIFTRLAAAWDLEKEVAEQVERERLYAQIRAGDGSRPYARVERGGRSESPFLAKTGRARRQAEADQRDLADDGRLNHST